MSIEISGFSESGRPSRCVFAGTEASQGRRPNEEGESQSWPIANVTWFFLLLLFCTFHLAQGTRPVEAFFLDRSIFQKLHLGCITYLYLKIRSFFT